MFKVKFLSWVSTSKFKVRFLHCDWHQGLSICSRHCISWTEKILIKIHHKVVTALHCILTLTLPTWGQFHQPNGAKCKCTSRHSLAPVSTVQFHQQNYTQLHHCAQIGNTLNFYAVRPTLCASKISVNLLRKSCTENVDEIDCRDQFHLFPTGSFCASKFMSNLMEQTAGPTV